MALFVRRRWATLQTASEARLGGAQRSEVAAEGFLMGLVLGVLPVGEVCVGVDVRGMGTCGVERGGSGERRAPMGTCGCER